MIRAVDVLNDRAPEASELERMLGPEVPLLLLLHEAYEVRRAHFGDRVQVHILNNAQNARCPEDCGYCSQSAVTNAPVRPYPWKPRDQLVAEAKQAHAAGAYRYCMVASGRGPTDRQIDELAQTVRQIKETVPVQVCVSLGLLDAEKARRLREAGVDRLNHNLNTSESHYPAICSTHTFRDRLETLRAARSAGLELCSGMIVGMGERDADIVEVALELRALDVPSIPVNFLIPIDGNPVTADGSITPERALRTLALFRMANPRAEIRVAGGREGHLRSLEPLALYPANSLFVEGYLTTQGRAAPDTYRMIRDAGFRVEGTDGEPIPWADLGIEEHAPFRLAGTDQILREELRR